MTTDSIALVVNGTVRRGCLDECWDKCERCHRWCGWMLVSPRGRETFICAECIVECGSPLPPCRRLHPRLEAEPQTTEPKPGQIRWREFHTTSDVSDAIVHHVPHPSFEEVESYVKAKAKFERLTRKHGFKRVEAKPSPNNRALWHPYWANKTKETSK